MAPIKTLIVDNRPLVHERLRSMLATADDIEVVGEASDGAQAARWAAGHDVDVVLLDLHMPGRDGLEAIGRIKAQRPAATVVMLTEHSDDASVIDAVLAGASGYLLEDASRDLLIYTVRAARGGGTLIKTSVLQDAIAGLERANGGRRLSPTPNGYVCEELTRRELEVLELVAGGLTNKEVARALYIADDTAKKHVQMIIGKLGASDRTHAVMLAARGGLIR
ncbi:MAG: response regulator transcription factor [Dehalococcoidia bacterium]|nr:response regulator transcription factor [Dehalococcoidia bacterium]